MTTSIDSNAELRSLFGAPGELALACMKDALDDYHARFIALSPFVCLATSDSDGQPYVSPKGDAPGFVTVVDAHTLLIPDRRGNNKVESFTNIVASPKVSLIFFVPGLPETLRILGTAQVTTDPGLLEPGRVRGVLPKAATRVHVTTAYFHCGKALVRSKLWSAESQVAKSDFPSFGEIIKNQAALDVSQSEAEDIITDMYTNGLY